MPTSLLRLVAGADAAGCAYKEAFRRDLEGSTLLASVVDVGVDASGTRSYPRVAIAAAELVIATGGGLCASRMGDAPWRGDRSEQGKWHTRRYGTRQALRRARVMSNSVQVLAFGERFTSASGLPVEWRSGDCNTDLKQHLFRLRGLAYINQYVKGYAVELEPNPLSPSQADPALVGTPGSVDREEPRGGWQPVCRRAVRKNREGASQ